MAVTPIYDPEKNGPPMRVAAFMSGSGTNIIKLIEYQRILGSKGDPSPFEVIFVFSDRSDGSCEGEQIAHEAGIPYISYDIRSFHRIRKAPRNIRTPEGRSARKKFDEVARRLIGSFEIDVVALGGYMSYITLDRCVNVHPADLSLVDASGRRKFVGDQAVLDAIEAGQAHLRASTLWIDQGVDTGPLLMVSDPIEVVLPEPLHNLKRNRNRLLQVAAQHQQRLKEVGDWKIFPRTIEMIARGRFALDDENRVYLDGNPVPKGYRE